MTSRTKKQTLEVVIIFMMLMVFEVSGTRGEFGP
jgi:hypothetical protein